MKTTGVVLASILTLAQSALAQPAVWPRPETLRADAARERDLTFPKAASDLSPSSSLQNGFFKPEGSGPFPAIVLLHYCTGVGADIRYWVAEALKEGYAVLIPDSMRGAHDNCSPPLKIWPGRRAKDALDAAAHLAKLAFIDAARIYAIGFSQGGNIVQLLAGGEASGAVRGFRAPRFAATAALYPACGWPLVPPGTPVRIEYLQDDTDRPLLLLMAEGDNEVSIPFCLELLNQVKRRGARVEWHMYPADVTHCWDCASADNFSKTDFKGDRIVYRYNRDVTENSRKRVFEFFGRYPAKR